MLNKAQLIGNLGADPDIRYLANGTAVASLSLATTRKWKDKSTGDRREETEWHRVVLFGRLAEICGEYLKKGQRIYIEGRLKTRKWQGQDGQDRYTTEIIAETMHMVSGKSMGDGPAEPYTATASTTTEMPQLQDYDDDIPY